MSPTSTANKIKKGGMSNLTARRPSASPIHGKNLPKIIKKEKKDHRPAPAGSRTRTDHDAVGSKVMVGNGVSCWGGGLGKKKGRWETLWGSLVQKQPSGSHNRLRKRQQRGKAPTMPAQGGQEHLEAPKRKKKKKFGGVKRVPWGPGQFKEEQDDPWRRGVKALGWEKGWAFCTENTRGRKWTRKKDRHPRPPHGGDKKAGQPR